MAANENTCDKRCNQICPDPHIRKRVGDKRILESLDQFCAGFYHAHKGRNYFCLDAQNCIIARKEIAQKAEEFATKAEEFSKKEKLSVEDANKFAMEAENFAKEADEFAKDANKCGDDLKTFAVEVKELVLKAKTFAKRFDSFEAEESIKEPNTIAWEVEEAARQARRFAENAKKSPKGWYAQPKTGVAVVKFENESGKILYEARYTNCGSQKMHAENFFKEDIKDKDGEFRELVQDNPKGTITLYLTQLQPCNKSTRLEGASGIMTDQSSCDILKEIATGILRADDQEIKLCVKVPHTNRLELEEPGIKKLERNAKGGIKELMEEGVNISGMTQDDWDYLFSLTEENGDRKDVAKYNKDRKDLDQEVEKIYRRKNSK